jgi:ABC-type Fe3+-citrate transport system substrate-binding protein
MNHRGLRASTLLVALSSILVLTGCSAPETNTPATAETVQTTPATARTPAPVGLEISSIDLHTDTPLIPLGLDDFHRLEVPEVDQPEVGGWFAMGVRPGDPGPR